MNRDMLVKAFIFTAGAAIGSVVTWKVIKTKYEQISNEEIESVREEYQRLTKIMRMEIDACRKATSAHTKDEAAANEDITDEDRYVTVDSDDADDYSDDDDRDFTEKEKEQIEYYKITSRYRGSYTENNEEGEENGDDEVPYINGPYVITPDEFASSPPGYNACPLDYYKDGILADGWGVQMDIEETIGEEALEHFGEYVDDVVYVRNERLELDYEVTQDPRTYKEAERAYSDPNSQYTR